jgi:photosystem II stability/assembly factor-like uncharacterized protein
MVKYISDRFYPGRTNVPYGARRRVPLAPCYLLLLMSAFGLSRTQAPADAQVHPTPSASALSHSRSHVSHKRRQSRSAHISPRRIPAPHVPMMQSVKRLQAHIAALEARSRQAHPVDDMDDAGPDALESYLFYLRQRAWPRDRIDPLAMWRAVRHRDGMPAATGIGQHGAGGRRLTAQAGGSGSQHGGGGSPPTVGLPNQWMFLGPNNLPVPYQQYYGQGPLSGRINGLSYDIAHTGTYYIATAGGGAWKTADSGVTWIPLSDGWPQMFTSSIAIDPTNTNVIYVGTGDWDLYYGTGLGIMKSIDGGLTWNKITPPGMDGCSVSAIQIDPENHNIITASTGRGANYWGNVWRSTDAGATWNIALPLQASWAGLACGAKDANGNRSYYTAAYYAFDQFGNDLGVQLYRSSDRGATWQSMTAPFPYRGNGTEVKVAASPNFPGTLYLTLDFDQQVGSIWKSVNYGASWQNVTNNFISNPGYAQYAWSQSYYDDHIEVGTGQDAQGRTQDVIYVGLIDLVRSTDGGQTWASLGGPTYTSNAILHNDQHSLMINPANAKEALVGCDGGVYRLTFDANNAPSYVSLNAHLGIAQLYHADYHPSDPSHLLGGAQDNACPALLGDPNTWHDEMGGDGSGCAINPQNPSLQYTCRENYYTFTTGKGIWRTTDDWNTSGPEYVDLGTDPFAFIPPLAIDPTTPSNVYIATDYLYQYLETTQSWNSQLGGQQLAGNYTGNGYVQCITVAPTDSNRIYTGSVDGEIWMTTDGGATWTELDRDTSGNILLPSQNGYPYAVTSIAVSLTNASHIIVGLSGSGEPHLWDCANTLAGDNLAWTNVSGSGASALPDISLNTIALDPDDPAHTFYVGTDVGVFQTLDAGATWQNVTTPLGLPNVDVNDLKAMPGTRYLNAATFGRGIWRIRLNTQIASLTLNPDPVVGGTAVTGTVTITDPAPQGAFR